MIVEVVLVANGIVTDDWGPSITRLRFDSQLMFQDWLAYGGSLAMDMKQQSDWDKAADE